MGYYAVIREKPSDIEHGIKKGYEKPGHKYIKRYIGKTGNIFMNTKRIIYL